MKLKHLGLGAALLALSAPASAAEVVPVPAFDEVQLMGGGDVVIRPGPVQRVTILNGSSQFTSMRVTGQGRGGGDKLEIRACNRRCQGRYDLRIEIVTPDLSAVAIHGGGRIVIAPGLPGRNDVAAAVKGGGHIDIRALPARDVAAAVHGGGAILVRPQATLAAAINGGGSIRYWGNPQITTAINGGGTVSRGR